MKTTMNRITAIVLALMCIVSLSACGDSVEKTGLWENATYTKDTQLGDGEKTLVVEVKAEEQTVKFTVKTDEKTVGAALLKEKLIAGDESEYGLYVKTVNGIQADYDKDGAYWAFYLGDNYADKGVDSTDIDESVTYRLEYTKG